MKRDNFRVKKKGIIDLLCAVYIVHNKKEQAEVLRDTAFMEKS